MADETNDVNVFDGLVVRPIEEIVREYLATINYLLVLDPEPMVVTINPIIERDREVRFGWRNGQPKEGLAEDFKLPLEAVEKIIIAGPA